MKTTIPDPSTSKGRGGIKLTEEQIIELITGKAPQKKKTGKKTTNQGTTSQYR